MPALLEALAAGEPAALEGVEGANEGVVAAAVEAGRWAYARAYGVGWASIAPFVVLAIVCVACLKGVRELMTDHVEATVEKMERARETEREVESGGGKGSGAAIVE